MSSRTLIVVNYRSAALTRGAIDSARRASALPLEVIVVDNSLDAAEAAQLRELDVDRLIVADENRGYSGGINSGLREATGEMVIVSNPDVTYSDGAIDALAQATERADVAGPRFTWDGGGRWLLPPADSATATEKLFAAAARRFSKLARRRSVARFRRRVAFWQLQETTSISALSGAVLAFRRETLDRVGPFDERFRLYFEETDYLRRVQRDGGKVVYVPAATCRHAYNQSAGSSPAARALFSESESAYYAKWYGRWVARAAALLSPPQAAAAATYRESDLPRIELACDPQSVVVEVSPLSDFDVAAGHFPDAPVVALPADVIADCRDDELFIRVIDRTSAAVLDAVSWRKRS